MLFQWHGAITERRYLDKRAAAGSYLEEQHKLSHRNDWNDYAILAEGRHAQLWLNGQKTVDYTAPDTSIPKESVFGQQMYKGTSAEAWCKDTVIRELPGN